MAKGCGGGEGAQPVAARKQDSEGGRSENAPVQVTPASDPCPVRPRFLTAHSAMDSWMDESADEYSAPMVHSPRIWEEFYM